MIGEPRCFTRDCKHFLGVRQIDEEEIGEVVHCLAFPDGIPAEIAYGDNLHTEKFPGQKTSYVYEKGTGEELL